MGLDGMEVIAIVVVIGLFVVVLKQFGIWEPLSLEGKTYKEQVWRSLYVKISFCASEQQQCKSCSSLFDFIECKLMLK